MTWLGAIDWGAVRDWATLAAAVAAAVFPAYLFLRSRGEETQQRLYTKTFRAGGQVLRLVIRYTPEHLGAGIEAQLKIKGPKGAVILAGGAREAAAALTNTKGEKPINPAGGVTSHAVRLIRRSHRDTPDSVSAEEFIWTPSGTLSASVAIEVIDRASRKRLISVTRAISPIE